MALRTVVKSANGLPRFQVQTEQLSIADLKQAIGQNQFVMSGTDQTFTSTTALHDIILAVSYISGGLTVRDLNTNTVLATPAGMDLDLSGAPLRFDGGLSFVGTGVITGGVIHANYGT